MNEPLLLRTRARHGLLGFLVLALTACGGGGDGVDVAADDPTPSTRVTAAPTPSGTPAGTAPLRLVYTNGTALWAVDVGGKPRRIAGRDAGIGLDVSPDGRTIAFSPEGTGLYVVGVDGRGLRLLDKTGGFEGNRAFSPDGRTVLTIRADGVFALALDGGEPRRLTYDYREPVQFHPSGVFVGVLGDKVLKTVPVAGGPATPVLATDRPITRFAFSPDGRRLVYSVETNDDFDSDLWVADVDGTNVRRLTTTGDVAVASWSPDSARLAFHRGGDKGVWTIGLDGADLRRVVARGTYPEFSPDGGYLAFLDGASRLRLVRVDGSGGKTIAKVAASSFAFAPATT